MKKIIAVIGDANLENDIEKQRISFELGRLIIDSGYILATGGLGGVMEYASKGAKTSENYSPNSIIGVLPDYNPDNANPHIDICIPTGLGLSRNLILTSLASAVIAVGGGSGTLNEISSAWQMDKLIIGLKAGGWSERLCGTALDERRKDIIFCAETPQEAIGILNEKLPSYNKKFFGVRNSRIGKKRAKEILVEFFILDTDNVEFLGKGSEGYVFTDYQSIYKIIDAHNEYYSQKIFFILLSCSEKSKNNKHFKHIIPFEVFLDNKKFILIRNKYIESQVFGEQFSQEKEFISLLKEFKRIKLVTTDFQPKNLRVSLEKTIFVSDLGHSLASYSEVLFQSMSRRAFITYKLQGRFDNYKSFKKYLSPANTTDDFSLMLELGFDLNDLKREFVKFYQKVITANKNEVLIPVIKEIFTSHIKVYDVFDYGSGYGDISATLKKTGLRVVAYEPDRKIFEKYRDSYYKDIECLNFSETKELIKNNKIFDSVLCSLVLCHFLAETKEKRLQEIDGIMSQLTRLSKKYIVIVICNPLYTYQSYSLLQKRILPQDFNYQVEVEFKKHIFSSDRERFDIHRPISFYENLFIQHKLNIKEIIQTNDDNPTSGIKNSDFMIFILEKKCPLQTS